MLIGELLFSSSDSVNTGETARGGNAASFGVDVTQITTSATLNIEIQHKNYNEDTWVSAAAFEQITSGAPMPASKVATDLRQEVRLQMTCGGGTGQWLRVVSLPPVWKDS